MKEAIELLFKYGGRSYSCIANISPLPEGEHIHIELLHDELTDLFQGEDIEYFGDNGYRKLPAYKDQFARPLLLHLVSCLQTIRHIFHNYPKE